MVIRILSLIGITTDTATTMMKPKEDITAATKDEINYIYSLDHKERTKSQENFINKYEALHRRG